MADLEKRALTSLRILGAVAAGLVLAALPLTRFVFVASHGAAGHTNHESRHGGQLGMTGDHHIEVRRKTGAIEIFVSDASRRPVRPAAASASFDGAPPTALHWAGHRFLGDDVPGARVVVATVVLADGTPLEISFDFPALLGGAAPATSKAMEKLLVYHNPG